MASQKSISEAARALSARRKTFSGGDSTKLGPCRHCGELFGARARRAHEPRCPQKPVRRSSAN